MSCSLMTMRLPAAGAVLLVLALGAPAAAPASPATGRVLVGLRSTSGSVAHASAVHALLARVPARRAGPSAPDIGMVTLRPTVRGQASALVRKLRRDPAVRYAELERTMKLRYVPNDPALTDAETGQGTAPGTVVEWEAARQGFFGAWDISKGDGATVAIVDTGVDSGQPDLAGKIAVAVDQGGSGTVADTVGHGTHVASLACGAGNNGVGIAGAGLNCKLIIEKIAASDGGLSNGAIAAAISDAARRGADAINMSFGDDTGGHSQAIEDALTDAYNRGSILVAAAADNPQTDQGQPASSLQPTGTGQDLASGRGLSVTAANFDGAKADFAGYGSQISLAAYGTLGNAGNGDVRRFGLLGAFPGATVSLELPTLGIPPDPGCQCRTTFHGDNRWAYLAGTSMATPQVAAIAALVRHLNPGLSTPDVLQILKRTASRPSGTAWNAQLGWGILDARAALDAARKLDRKPPTSKLRAPHRTHSTRFTLRWKGKDTAHKPLIASGIKRYDVYARPAGGKAKRIARTRHTHMRFRGKRGKRYDFWTVATDRQGNREAVPKHPDARTRVLR